MVKPLYVANSIKELDVLAEIESYTKNKTAKQLANSTITLREKADDCYNGGDEESAYIFYRKYFNLIDIIRKLNDYPTIENRRRKYFGSREEVLSRMHRLCNIVESLEKRYEEKNEILEKQKLAEAKKANIPNEESSDDVQKSAFIKCGQLRKRISEAKEAIMLLDCRSSVDFMQSRIKFDRTINIASDIIQLGQTPSALSKLLSPDSQKLFETRGKMDLIVLIDEDTSEDKAFAQGKSIWILHNAFIFWDPDTTYKEISILDGGFQNFLITYPTLTTNPKYQPKLMEVPMSSATTKEIEYPSLADIKMKPDLNNISTNSRPQFDRSSKPAFGQKFNNSQQPLNVVAVAREREMILDKVLKVEEEVLKIEDQLSTIANAPLTNETLNIQMELEYKLVQKESELDDIKTGLNDTIVQLDNPEILDIAMRITFKELEHLKNEIKMKQKNAEIEEKLRQAREYKKRQLELKDEEEEIVNIPKRPTIDRSVKPGLDGGIARFPQTRRDFSPVQGSYGEIGATGLKNLGNTCYMNSIIQCLLNLGEFRLYLMTDKYLKHINRKSKTHGMVTEELAHLCKQIWSGKFKSVAPRDFRNVIGQEHKMFATYDQQDAHELLVILIDMLHSELQMPINNAMIDPSNKSDVSWYEFSKNMQSIIQSLFFGQIQSTVKCMTCGFESATFEGFSHLSLELPQNNLQCELNDCLDLYFNGEVIEGWTCPECKKTRDAIKKLDISKLPPVLVIHLKRFYASLDSPSTYIKKQNYVRFPIQDFNISDYIIRSLKQRHAFHTVYNLFAVANHYGTMNRGHYTAFCKNDNSNQWYKYDDNYVTHIASNDVNSSAGYILFYSNFNS